jgi:hypothetical protein
VTGPLIPFHLIRSPGANDEKQREEKTQNAAPSSHARGTAGPSSFRCGSRGFQHFETDSLDGGETETYILRALPRDRRRPSVWTLIS